MAHGSFQTSGDIEYLPIPLSRRRRGNAAQGAAPLNIGPLGIEPGGSHTQSTTLTVSSVPLSTVYNNDVIVAFILTNGGPNLSVVGSSLGPFTKIASVSVSGTPAQQVDLWAKWSPGLLASEVITVTTTTANFLVLEAFAVSGTKGSSLVWDSGSPVTGTADPVSLTTVSTKTFALCGMRESATANPGPGAGWTLHNGQDYILTESQILTTASTISCSQTIAAVGSANGVIGAAIVCH